jgi:hypothetical protein
MRVVEVPRQCPLVLLAKECCREGNASRSREGVSDDKWTVLGCDQWNEAEQNLTAFARNFEFSY